MSNDTLICRLNALVGADTRITVDDEIRPTRLSFHRADRLTDELVRDAITRARDEFPREMAALRNVFVAYRDSLGETRRRVAA